MVREIHDWQAVDLSEVHHNAFGVDLGAVYPGQQVQTFNPALSDAFPSAFRRKIRVGFFPFRQPINGANGYQRSLAIFKVAALRQNDDAPNFKVEVYDTAFQWIGLGQQNGDVAPFQPIALVESGSFDGLPPCFVLFVLEPGHCSCYSPVKSYSIGLPTVTV